MNFIVGYIKCMCSIFALVSFWTFQSHLKMLLAAFRVSIHTIHIRHIGGPLFSVVRTTKMLRTVFFFLYPPFVDLSLFITKQILFFFSVLCLFFFSYKSSSVMVDGMAGCTRATML